MTPPLCPICYSECTEKLTNKGIFLGYTCSIKTESKFYHRYIYFSNHNFMAAIYFPCRIEDEDNIIVGVYKELTSLKYVFATKNKSFNIKEFYPCESLDVINKYMNMKALF